MLYIIAFVAACATGIIIRIERVYRFRSYILQVCYDAQINHPDLFDNTGWDFYLKEIPSTSRMIFSFKPLRLSRWASWKALGVLRNSLPEHYKWPKGLRY
jgi:hypothetical protein